MPGLRALLSPHPARRPVFPPARDQEAPRPHWSLFMTNTLAGAHYFCSDQFPASKRPARGRRKGEVSDQLLAAPHGLQGPPGLPDLPWGGLETHPLLPLYPQFLPRESRGARCRPSLLARSLGSQRPWGEGEAPGDIRSHPHPTPTGHRTTFLPPELLSTMSACFSGQPPGPFFQKSPAVHLPQLWALSTTPEPSGEPGTPSSQTPPHLPCPD